MEDSKANSAREMSKNHIGESGQFEGQFDVENSGLWEQFERQVVMDDIGTEGQRRLLASKVLIVGAGGLCSPVITYLAAAGVGTLYIVDGDVVGTSNLNRQFIHTPARVGLSKAESAKEYVEEHFPRIEVKVWSRRLCTSLMYDLVRKVDCVIDCVDNNETRIAVGRACIKENVPLVEAGVAGWHGWTMNIDREHACLQCAGITSDPNSGSTPILGATAGVIGSLQALATIRILLGLPVRYGVMSLYDGTDGSFDEVEIQINLIDHEH